MTMEMSGVINDSILSKSYITKENGLMRTRVIDLTTTTITNKFFRSLYRDIAKSRDYYQLHVARSQVSSKQYFELLDLASNHKNITIHMSQDGSESTHMPLYANWSRYNAEKKEAYGLRSTTKEALKKFVNAPTVVVVHGCGTGQEVLPLLERGCGVWAFDADQEAYEILKSRVIDDEQKKRFHPFHCSFLDFVPPEEKIELFISSYTMPYRSAELFGKSWEKLVEILPANSLFCGQLFGNKHQEHQDPNITCHSLEQAIELLKKDFKLLDFKEEEGDNIVPTYGAADKSASFYWHLYHIVAQRK